MRGSVFAGPWPRDTTGLGTEPPGLWFNDGRVKKVAPQPHASALDGICRHEMEFTRRELADRPGPPRGLERPVDWGMSLLGAATLTLGGLLFSTALPFRGRLLIGATLVLAILALGGSLLGTARGVSPVATAASCM